MNDSDVFDPIYSRALLLIAHLSDNFLELASLMRVIHDDAPDDFKKLVKMPQLGRRKAYYLIEIDKAFADLGVPPLRLNKIGWTKLQVIAQHVTPDNVGQLLKLAETNTTENLKAILRGDEPIIGGRSVLLLLTGVQFAKFSEAILNCGAIANGQGFIAKEAALIAAIEKNKE